MPTSFDPDLLEVPPRVHLRHHLPNAQPHAVDLMQGWHDDALYAFGEYSMFIILWHIEDHEAGLVERCSNCQEPYGPYAEVYRQPMEARCETCFGTTFEGGYRAKIIRPALWDFGEDVDEAGRRGETESALAAVQSTSDFRLRNNDWIIRADGTRWQVEAQSANHLRTGFSFPQKSQSVIGFNYGQVRKEDEASNVYLVPPIGAGEVREILDVRGVRYPQTFAAYEDIRAPVTADPDPTP